MTHTVTLETTQAFFKAYAGRDIARMAEFIADDVEWTISGPVGVLPFCGTQHGKKAVLALFEEGIPAVYRVVNFVLDQLLVDGDRVASLNRLSAHGPDGRVISYRLAHFFRFRDGKIVENLSLIDSFDAVEQVLGYPLVPDSPPLADVDAGDVVAV